jgi:diguanylate cyclase (GGDEF)-like protein
MTVSRGSLARLERSREELAKAWLVKLIERASLDEIRELPTERIARELPELISDMVAAIGDGNSDPYELAGAQTQRAAGLAALRGGHDTGPGELARDVAALHTVLLRALRDELADSNPADFADAAERLVDAAGAIQAAACEELLRMRSRELETQANTDPLTGLGNLRHLQSELARMVDLQKRYGQGFGLLLMDIDGLKRVNDAHGHPAGDRLLMQVAISLQRGVRNVDVAARLGGDEFCVLAPQQDVEGARNLGQRLAKAVREEVSVGEGAPVGLSVGVVSCPLHGSDAEILVESADRAMYMAKAEGGSVAVAEPPAVEVTENGAPTQR